MVMCWAVYNVNRGLDLRPFVPGHWPRYHVTRKINYRCYYKMVNIQRIFIYPILGLLSASVQVISKASVCNSSIFCSGDLLHKVQLARIFPDSKTFVDLTLKNTQNKTLADFAKLMRNTDNNPSRPQLIEFVDAHFTDTNQLIPWTPPDFQEKPPIIDEIVDPKLRSFAKHVIGIWEKLGRKVDPEVAQNPDKSSLLYVPHGFIIPGGRFKELYYWDSYWIVQGLLVSNMTETAKSMIENLLYLVDKIGHIPNGSRIYYVGRSHPPLLTAMVASYYDATGDREFLAKHISTIEKELQYWLDNKNVTVEIKGRKYFLLRYIADMKNGPRPESYFEDYTNAEPMPNDNVRENFYLQVKSAAESGWDFSSRWIYSTTNSTLGNLTDLRTTSILPVDLNSIFAGALESAGEFRSQLKDNAKAEKWWRLAKRWRNTISSVFYDQKDGVWYDYDMDTKMLRKNFYPSCVAPLWAGAVDVDLAPKYASRLVRYLLSSTALNYPGGVPTSILDTGEQWDYPNAWPPLQSIIIGGLDRSGYKKAQHLAKELAVMWLRANYKGYDTWDKMFEKYNALYPGQQGNGGEYIVQDGFGWTNGIILELLSRYGKEIHLNAVRQSPPSVQKI